MAHKFLSNIDMDGNEIKNEKNIKELKKEVEELKNQIKELFRLIEK